MSLQAVLFDLDGTLLDRCQTFRDFLERQLARRCALAASRADLDRMMVIDDNGSCRRSDFYARIETEFELPSGIAPQLVDDFNAAFPETCVPMPNLWPMLQSLREARLRLGVITNGDATIQARKIDRLGLRPLMDAVLISGAFGVPKPDPRIFAEALAQLGVVASAAAYVGDHPEADMLGARRSGLFAIWRRDRFFADPEAADAVIDDLAELPPLLVPMAQPF